MAMPVDANALDISPRVDGMGARSRARPHARSLSKESLESTLNRKLLPYTQGLPHAHRDVPDIFAEMRSIIILKTGLAGIEKQDEDIESNRQCQRMTRSQQASVRSEDQRQDMVTSPTSEGRAQTAFQVEVNRNYRISLIR